MFLLKLSDFLNKVSFKLKQKAIYFELKWYIKNNESYFKRIHYYERVIGKTFSLIQLAHKYNCPIAVNSRKSEDHVQNLSIIYFNKPIRTIVCDTSFIGRRYDLILLEEGVREDFINEVLKPMSKCIVGYISRY